MTNQRWRDRQSTFRKPDEQIKSSEYDVAAIPETAAKPFIVRHHYSGTYPAARFRFGLFHKGTLVGIAVFSHPCNNAVLTGVFDLASANDAVELGRFVLLDEVPGNGETWFLGRCFRLLRKEGLGGIVSFSDPMPRTDSAGQRVFLGHIGTIYQAHNARYLGRATGRLLRLLPDGRVFSDRAISKIRGKEQGWQYAVRQLVAAGARPPECEDGLRDWLKEALPEVTRTVRHPGNHRYAWTFGPRIKLASEPYPKWVLQ